MSQKDLPLPRYVFSSVEDVLRAGREVRAPFEYAWDGAVTAALCSMDHSRRDEIQRALVRVLCGSGGGIVRRMAVPDFQSVMRPVLVALGDGQDRKPNAIRDAVATHFSLSQEDLEEEIPSGRAKTFQNRVGWALTYLYRAGLIERPKHAVYRITERGRTVLEQHPRRVDMKVLAEFDEFRDFKQTSKPTHDGGEVTESAGSDAQTPEERIAISHRELRSALAADLLDQIRSRPPEFLEDLVLDVLQKMGYGGRRDDAAQRLGQSGDEGVDGVIREDSLGLDQIYVQAKRWANPVGRPEIQKFFGALHGKRATKGVFITTSAFSKEAIDYAEGVTPRVILIDGKELADLMIEHGVGVTLVEQYQVKRVDIGYFASEEDSEVLLEAVPTDPLRQSAADGVG